MELNKDNLVPIRRENKKEYQFEDSEILEFGWKTRKIMKIDQNQAKSIENCDLGQFSCFFLFFILIPGFHYLQIGISFYFLEKSVRDYVYLVP